MMSESKTNRPMTDKEREEFLQELLKERFGNPTRERYQNTNSAK